MRIIDADALKEVIWNNVYLVQDVFNSRDCGMFWTGGIEKAIDEAPTIDIDSIIAEHENIGYEKGHRDGYAEAVDTKPVRHGHWIKREHAHSSDSGIYRYECSECHCSDEHNESREVPYCWQCGALMDGAEFALVKHGKWVKCEKSDFEWECSECGYGVTDYKLTYCYDCGAKMDLDEVGKNETD